MEVETKLRGDSKQPRAALGKQKKRRAYPTAGSGTSGSPRAETATAQGMWLSDTRQSRDECLHGHSSGPVPRESSCHRRTSREMQTSADEPCSPPGPRPKVGWPTEAEARWIIKREDDPEEESPQSNDETAEESRSLMTRPHRQVQFGGREASTGEVAGGDQRTQARLTKVTSTVTAR